MTTVRALLLLAVVLGAACDGHHHEVESGDLPDVVYVGATTDEALARLLDLPPRDDAARRVVVDAPAEGAPLDAAAPATIAFHAVGATALGRRPRPPGLLAELAALLGPIRRAEAHGAAFNGTGYFLSIADHAGQVRLRVFTDKTSYTSEVTAWSALCAAPQPLTLTITWAAFEANAIPDGGGPFVGATLALGRR